MAEVKARKRKKKPEQLKVPGTEREKDAELHDAAKDLADAREALDEAQDENEAASDRMIALLRKKEKLSYVDEDLGVRVDLAEGKAKIRLKKLENDNHADDDELHE